MRPRFALLVVASLITGCGSPNVVPVSGRVTLDGKPAVGVHVGFQPVATEGNKNPGGGSYAITDADGRFTLRLVEGGGSGAVVGKHRVEIATKQGTDNATDSRVKGPDPRSVVPAKYNRNSDLTFDVPNGGTDKADFTLTSR
jgi:hypothetical protein